MPCALPIGSWRRHAIGALGTRAGWSGRARLAAILALFALGLAVRSLHAIDLRPVMDTPLQPGVRMTRHYEAQAREIEVGEGILFPRHAQAGATGPIARPPGYALFLASVYSGLGRSTQTVQLVQDLLDALSAVVVFLIGELLLGPGVGLGGGLVVALSPHFAHYSNLLLPDEPCVLLVLVGVLCVAHGRGAGRRLGWHALGGLALGASTWLRPNTLALAAFLGLGLLVLQPWRLAWMRATVLASVAGAVVAPITLRNYLVYGAFVPVSTNMGIVLWEGIADAGGQRFGAFPTDRQVARDEARLFNEPRYRQWWASPDGIARDRFRVRRSLAVIRENPAWFARAMLARMWSMIDYAKAAPPRVAPGSALRTLVRWAQAALTASLGVASALGLAVAGLIAPRRTALLAIVPFAYLVLQAPMHLEFRVTLPMHALVALFAGVSAVFVLRETRLVLGRIPR
jgi:Dolichyl-phosphate-mannose-protein mannosyltransferase